MYNKLVTNKNKYKQKQTKMKKTIITIVTALIITSCGTANKEETTNADSTAVVVAVDTLATDSTKVDSLACCVDSLKK